MRVHVGPIPSDTATAWITFARGVVDDRLADMTSPALSPEVRSGFVGFLDEWAAVAAASPTFLWQTEVDPEQIEFLALALHRVASELSDAAVARGYGLMPEEGTPFYRAFISAFLDAMAGESRTLAAYAEELRSSWPGL